MQPKNPIRFYHIGDTSNKSGLGVMTVATEVIAEKDEFLDQL